jgi:hypothetical protein
VTGATRRGNAPITERVVVRTSTVGVHAPFCVGVPLITPLDERLSPGGNE